MNRGIRARIWKKRVRTKVVRGEMEGRTAKVVSPTNPRVTEVRALSSRGRPSFGATSGGG